MVIEISSVKLRKTDDARRGSPLLVNADELTRIARGGATLLRFRQPVATDRLINRLEAAIFSVGHGSGGCFFRLSDYGSSRADVRFHGRGATIEVVNTVAGRRLVAEEFAFPYRHARRSNLRRAVEQIDRAALLAYPIPVELVWSKEPRE